MNNTIEPVVITKDDIRYAIVAKDENDITIVVCFWAEGYTFTETYNIKLPVDIVTKAIPTGEQLRELIMQYAPVEALRMKIQNYKDAVMVDWSEVDRLIAETKNLVPKEM